MLDSDVNICPERNPHQFPVHWSHVNHIIIEGSFTNPIQGSLAAQVPVAYGWIVQLVSVVDTVDLHSQTHVPVAKVDPVHVALIACHGSQKSYAYPLPEGYLQKNVS